MPADLQFKFYLADRNRSVRWDDPLIAAPLPLNRTGAAPPPGRPEFPPVTYGDYFSAIRDFFLKDPAGTLGRACSELLKVPVSPSAIERVDVFLSKHGEFYHPCRVVAVIANESVELVLNGAVSKPGLQTIDREYRNLERLGTDFGFDSVPRAYACGKGGDLNDRPIPMFLAQWFAGFHECHLSRDPRGGPDRIHVWDAGDESSRLTPSQAVEFYRECARILTSYYNPLTFEQVFPWHHAAGDFIVSLDGGRIRVKLITVRGYAPLFAAQTESRDDAGTAIDEARILDGLMVFFLSMSLRMRLDRLDGVGQIVWAPDEAVKGAVSGYFQGLASICEHYDFPEDLPEYVRRYLLAHPLDELADLCAQIGGSYPPGSEEAVTIRRCSESHAKAIRRQIASN